jgi:diaminopimelate epimerase
MRFYKYHALGNDYIVLDPAEAGEALSKDRIRLICQRNYGVGADGILFGPFPKEGYEFALRIFNPDGSEAEKSGNGLRIFSRYLRDKGKVGDEPFMILTKGGSVAEVCEGRISGDLLDPPAIERSDRCGFCPCGDSC